MQNAKMEKKIGSSLDMANNLKVAFFGQILSNIHFYIWCITYLKVYFWPGQEKICS